MEVAGHTVLAQPATLEVVVMCSSFLLDVFGSKLLLIIFPRFTNGVIHGLLTFHLAFVELMPTNT